MVTDTYINYDEVAQWLEEYRKLKTSPKKTQMQNLIAIACMPLVKKNCPYSRQKKHRPY